MRLLLLLVWMLPAAAWAQGNDVPPPPLDDAPADVEAVETPAVDAFTQRLLALVDGYYAGIGHPADEAEREQALESIRTMLLDGVALPRVHAAVEDAIRLHSPGRIVPFHIAVPLRVRPAEAAPPVQKPPPPATAVPRPVDPEIEARRAAQRERANARRNRTRLYRQWRSRTRPKRTLVAIGIPLWAGGYSLGFGLGGLTVLSGQVDHQTAWLRAIPLVGQFIYFGAVASASGDIAADAILFGVLEVAGAGLTIVGLALKADWPYDRDPTAFRRHRPDGRLALEGRVVLTPAFAGVTGRF